MNHEERLKQYTAMINDGLGRAVPRGTGHQADLPEAMRYSLLAGGKRIRPVLLLEFCRVSGGNVKDALPFACALEMVHTYSLIHDDLPCMDNDDMRRGQAANHIVHGEATALLAGSSLLSGAFEAMLNVQNIKNTPPGRVIRAAFALARASGAYGIAGGQQLDMNPAKLSPDLKSLKQVNSLKTGALMEAAAQIGCIMGGAEARLTEYAAEYGKSIGEAFQIVDDILDAENGEGGDSGDKLTYVRVLGAEESRELAEKITKGAIENLSVFSERSFLAWLAEKLLAREN